MRNIYLLDFGIECVGFSFVDVLGVVCEMFIVFRQLDKVLVEIQMMKIMKVDVNRFGKVMDLGFECYLGV